jgi:hypothetical protein
MNRRELFQVVALLAGAATMKPDLLAEVLPRESTLPLSELVDVQVVLTPCAPPWPTYASMLAALLEGYEALFGVRPAAGSSDYVMLEEVARLGWQTQENLRALLLASSPLTAIGEDLDRLAKSGRRDGETDEELRKRILA